MQQQSGQPYRSQHGTQIFNRSVQGSLTGHPSHAHCSEFPYLRQRLSSLHVHPGIVSSSTVEIISLEDGLQDS